MSITTRRRRRMKQQTVHERRTLTLVDDRHKSNRQTVQSPDGGSGLSNIILVSWSSTTAGLVSENNLVNTGGGWVLLPSVSDAIAAELKSMMLLLDDGWSADRWLCVRIWRVIISRRLWISSKDERSEIGTYRCIWALWTWVRFLSTVRSLMSCEMITTRKHLSTDVTAIWL